MACCPNKERTVVVVLGEGGVVYGILLFGLLGEAGLAGLVGVVVLLLLLKLGVLLLLFLLLCGGMMGDVGGCCFSLTSGVSTGDSWGEMYLWAGFPKNIQKSTPNSSSLTLDMREIVFFLS